MNVKEIEEEIRKDYSQNKTNFSLDEVMNIISKKWFFNGGRDQEANEIFKLFDRKYLIHFEAVLCVIVFRRRKKKNKWL